MARLPKVGDMLNATSSIARRPAVSGPHPIRGTALLGLAPVQWWVALASGLLWLGVLALAAGAGAAHASPAQPAGSVAIEPDLSSVAEGGSTMAALVQGLAGQPLAQVAQPGSPRMEVVLGQLDSRMKLAPCKKMRAYWPAGQRAWGASRVGVRCEQGEVKWNVYWPVVVKVWVKGVVAMQPLRPGQVVSASDLQVAEVDLAAGTASALIRPADVLGRTLARAVPAGQGLRADDLRPRRYFAPGEPVALTVRGDGFQVAGQGTAITAGDEGQCARIRTDSGRVVCGVPVGERRAEITL
jgi:flagella basal body P-ring formation protein FlgA